MLLKDPKTFDEFLKRAAWGPWVAVALVSALMSILFVVAVVFERDPTKRLEPISETGKRAFAITTALIVVGGICVAPFWSRSIRILARRGQRVDGRIASYAPLAKGGARLVTIEYPVGEKLVRVNRDVPKGDVDQLIQTGLTLLYDPEKPSRMMVLPPEIASLPLR